MRLSIFNSEQSLKAGVYYLMYMYIDVGYLSLLFYIVAGLTIFILTWLLIHVDDFNDNVEQRWLNLSIYQSRNGN